VVEAALAGELCAPRESNSDSPVLSRAQPAGQEGAQLAPRRSRRVLVRARSMCQVRARRGAPAAPRRDGRAAAGDTSLRPPSLLRCDARWHRQVASPRRWQLLADGETSLFDGTRLLRASHYDALRAELGMSEDQMRSERGTSPDLEPPPAGSMHRAQA
jgi:hypothetical protein